MGEPNRSWWTFPVSGSAYAPDTARGVWLRPPAHLVDHVIPTVPLRQWVLSFPIPLRSLIKFHPELLAPVLQIIHRAIATFLIGQSGFKRDQAATGAVTLIQRFGSTANLNIQLHALMLDGVYGNLDATDTAGSTGEHTPAPAPNFATQYSRCSLLATVRQPGTMRHGPRFQPVRRRALRGR